MQTRPLDPTAYWMFFHDLQPLAAANRVLIRPLTEESAAALWCELVSADPRERHTMLLPAGHWVGNRTAAGPNWQVYWNDPGRPDDVAEFLRSQIDWPDEAEVCFIEMRERAALVPWGVFLRTWRAFLFRDEDPFVVRPGRPEFVVFGPTGYCGVGRRPR